MRTTSKGKNPDRFLTTRQGIYMYVRRVPKLAIDLDPRAPAIRISLGTRDLAMARIKRDAYEEADNALWGAYLGGDDRSNADARYRAAVARARALDFTYRPAADVMASETGDQIMFRLDALSSSPPKSMDATAVLGLEPRPRVRLSEAFELYLTEIAAPEVAGKSATQRRNWTKVRRRAVSNFIAVAGDKYFDEIDRQDALKLYRYWREKIAPADGPAQRSASSGNKDIGCLRNIWRSYQRYQGVSSDNNPFANLSFRDKNSAQRPPFSAEWLERCVLAPGALSGLNEEARHIVQILIETGARPSEICNLVTEQIHLDHEVPHIAIAPRADRADPREIKTTSSIRLVPLTGVALAAMRFHPDGFPRYKNREETLSQTLNKYFRARSLFPTSKHKIYSIRHAFEDRMKEAGLDTELRMMVMGHAIDRPKYGSGGSLEWRRQELERITLSFDESCL
ncbi:tyrosine-type recombinase/integrase [Martelella radicis]|uniref:Integrase n=1 Tax=Martelella radicis TaxID=1397476 RepID=A0A7W6PBB9_9HYPH|nr:tyrosine-type recombinase/integrase [Martelella radicis]MBB4124312.1 integrase [Martelella radicis]